MESEQPYNPLDKKNLGVSIADALLAKPVSPLPPVNSFNGAGIYAIYYIGNYPPYEAIAKQNQKEFTFPIYVGKAVPSGARKGGFLETTAGPVLYNRLCEHARSIEQVKNLELKDFFCRYLVVDDFWIPLGESLLIDRFAPIWNMVLDGFGNHDPGSGRYNQQRSPWDVIHPGRPWADKLQPNKLSSEEFLSNIDKFIQERIT